MTNIKNLKTILIAVIVGVLGVTIAYAALSSTLNITTSSITQSTLNWNVGFQTGTVEATVGGTSDTGRSCGNATVTATSVTVGNTTLSKPDDSCTYQLTIKNTGTIDAILSSINVIEPTSTSCTVSGSSMECGNLTYKLSTDAAGTGLVTTNTTLNANGNKTIYLIVKYTGNSLNTSNVTQFGGSFSVVFTQK